MARTLSIIMLSVLCLLVLQVYGANRSFIIDYDKDTFLKDGEPFRYISGSIHYSRVPEFYWRDRLMKMYASGLNAVQVYIPWNYHEQRPGEYDFSGGRDVAKFIQLAQDIGLLVILRPGPYICAEWDFGGFPAWLLKNNASMVLRSMDPGYIEPMDKWLTVILTKMRPLLYSNGGPIISVQVENEYGSYFACDYDYLRHLRTLFLDILGNNVILFTTDGAGVSYLKCGTLEGLYSTIDFGMTLNPAKQFEVMRKYEPRGPLVNSEFYAGWLDHWGHPFVTVQGKAFAFSLNLVLQYGANVNIYMFHGGTNFGYTNGANYGAAPYPLQSHITSYDYDAPISEAGDITPKYMEIRDVISKYRTLPKVPIPPSTKKYGYGKVDMAFDITLNEAIAAGMLDPVVHSLYPQTMEQVGKGDTYAYILYRTTLPSSVSSVNLTIEMIRDLAYIFVGSMGYQGLQGVLIRGNKTSLRITGKQGDTLDILVENLGHINYGSQLVNNSKGLLTNVTLNNKTLKTWEIYPLYLENIIKAFKEQPARLQEISHRRRSNPLKDVDFTPAFWIGKFQMPNNSVEPMDTFLDPRPFSKGHAFINQFNLGRYWPSYGPQVTLFVPKSELKPFPEFNTVMLFELEDAPCTLKNASNICHVTFADKAFLNKTIAGSLQTPTDLDWNFDWQRSSLSPEGIHSIQ